MIRLSNGLYRIKNTTTGETRDVKASDLSQYGLSAPGGGVTSGPYSTNPAIGAPQQISDIARTWAPGGKLVTDLLGEGVGMMGDTQNNPFATQQEISNIGKNPYKTAQQDVSSGLNAITDLLIPAAKNSPFIQKALLAALSGGSYAASQPGANRNNVAITAGLNSIIGPTLTNALSGIAGSSMQASFGEGSGDIQPTLEETGQKLRPGMSKGDVISALKTGATKTGKKLSTDLASSGLNIDASGLEDTLNNPDLQYNSGVQGGALDKDMPLIKKQLATVFNDTAKEYYGSQAGETTIQKGGKEGIQVATSGTPTATINSKTGEVTIPSKPLDLGFWNKFRQNVQNLVKQEGGYDESGIAKSDRGKVFNLISKQINANIDQTAQQAALEQPLGVGKPLDPEALRTTSKKALGLSNKLEQQGRWGNNLGGFVSRYGKAAALGIPLSAAYHSMGGGNISPMIAGMVPLVAAAQPQVATTLSSAANSQMTPALINILSSITSNKVGQKYGGR